MATSLINTTPQNTYPSLLKLGDNSALSATLKRISDGAGNDTPIEISTAAVQFGGSTGMYWDNTNRRLGIGTNAPTTAVDVNGSIRAGVNLTVVGEIQNPTVGVVNINGELRVASPNVSIGLTSYPARLAVRGSGATSATTALRIENSAGTASLSVLDNAAVVLGGTVSTLTSTPNDILITSSNNRVNGNWCVGNGGYNNASSILQADSTTKGFLPPRMTTAQRDAIVSPATGLKIYNTTLGTTDTYDGTSWQRVGKQTLIKGTGATLATTALRVEDSAATSLFEVRDDGAISVKSSGTTEFGWTNGTRQILFNYNNGMQIRGFNGVALTTYDGASYTDALTVTGNGTQRVGIGTTSPTSRLQVRGSGATSATTALRVENSAGTSTFEVKDNGAITSLSTFTTLGGIFAYGANEFVSTGQAGSFTGSVRVGASGNNNASAILDAVSTTKGFLPPRMTTTQKNAIASPAAGLMVYDTDTNKLCCYNGTTWNDLF